MNRLSLGDKAPDFTLPDHKGVLFKLSDVYSAQNVLMVFNLGFVWPHCTNHMAQLRHDYKEFKALDTEVLVMVPNGPRMIEKYVNKNKPPYPILSDKGSKVAAQYFQVKHFFLVGTPTVFLVNKKGQVLYAHYASSIIEEPDNKEPLAVLKREV